VKGVETAGTFTIRQTALVRAPIERCFELTCSLALVQEELKMRPKSDRTGLVEGGDVIRWEGWQLGWRHFHVSKISGYEKPVFLQDTMLDGRFRTFQHDHHLRETPEGTVLEDEVRFSLPFGVLGRLVARFIMVPYILRLMRNRFGRIRELAETEGWRRFRP
jgi:hypothetical protein